jgi:hypothetical protein
MKSENRDRPEDITFSKWVQGLTAKINKYYNHQDYGVLGYICSVSGVLAATIGPWKGPEGSTTGVSAKGA